MNTQPGFASACIYNGQDDAKGAKWMWPSALGEASFGFSELLLRFQRRGKKNTYSIYEATGISHQRKDNNVGDTWATKREHKFKEAEYKRVKEEQNSSRRGKTNVIRFIIELEELLKLCQSLIRMPTNIQGSNIQGLKSLF